MDKLTKLKECCVKFSREYVYDDYDKRPSHILYRLYFNNGEYRNIQLNPYITDRIYLFNDEEMINFIWDKNIRAYVKK